MNKYAFLLLLLLSGLIGCQSGEKPTPTPFPTAPALGTLPVAPVGAKGIPVSLADLLADPEFFAGTLVEVTGVYGRQPRLVCGANPHPSPATWTLQDGESLIQAGGFDDPLSELFPVGLTMTVLGKVVHWQGPVGCGKQAVPKDFWYLDVTHLINPSQLARVTLTPFLGEEPAVEPTPLEAPIQEIGPPIVAPTAVSAAPTVVIPTDFAVPVLPTVTSSNEFTGTLVTTTPISQTTVTPIVVTTGTSISATPSLAVTLTPSLTPRPGTTSTPTATVPPNSTATTAPKPTIVDRGSMNYYDAFSDKFGANETHNWTVFLEAGLPITVSVVAEPEIDLGLRMLSPTGAVLVDRNQVPAGQVESLRLDVTADDDYVIQVYTLGGQSGRYYISLWNETGDYRPMGTLQSGVARSGTVNDVTTHVWFFKAEAGQTINVQTTSASGSDLLLLLLNPNDELLTYQSKTISNFRLEESGWFALEVEEYLLTLNTYQLTMTLQ
ncbi:MAG: hypothetical protein IPM76_05290 [Chloroflexi bacterium]|nr:hypothetical protein [Chloroflexota bacterium]